MGESVMGESVGQSAGRCPVCGGPATDVEVSIDFWRGGVEPLTICACKDVACEAHCPDSVGSWFL
jgi:hypothetical protein